MKVIAPNDSATLVEKEKQDDDIIVLDSEDEEDVPLIKLQKNPT